MGQAAEHPSAAPTQPASPPSAAPPSHSPHTAEAADLGWSEAEQAVARRAFELAQLRAINGLVQAVQTQAAALDGVDSVWMLHDFLSIQRHAIEGRFDFRLPGLLFVFASLVRDELLSMEELGGLDALKLAKIAAMARF